ncbi:CGNR zinc finger domain-containing protein [Actinoplanes sp. NPDC051861]|uniref:CGNR zinc finger domain-containing protein n=1 Tax=Actinoplanes sp. NPDC051861 TaxID=3155170 RepID=UPI00342F645C
MPTSDEALLLDLLNTTPVIDGSPRDDLADAGAGHAWLAAHGRPVGDDEWRALVAARDTLQKLVRGTGTAATLAPFLDGVRTRATAGADGVDWVLDLPGGRSAAAQAVLAWDELRRSSPGRLRPCANTECHLFLVDHSRSNNARWCSMAICGNRMKARRHYERNRPAATN